MRKGIVTGIGIVKPRKPNSARRKVARVRLFYNGITVAATIPGEGHDLHEHSTVTLRRSHQKDLPGINFTIIRGLSDMSSYERRPRGQKRSKYGVKMDDSTRAGKRGGRNAKKKSS